MTDARLPAAPSSVAPVGLLPMTKLRLAASCSHRGTADIFDGQRGFDEDLEEIDDWWCQNGGVLGCRASYLGP